MLSIGANAGIPVLVGVPCMGELRMWTEHERHVFFIDDVVLPRVLGWGRVARARLGDGREREIGFLDVDTPALTLLPREAGTRLAEGVRFDGHTVQLNDTIDPLVSGLHELEAVLASAVFHAAMTGETVRLEPGAWTSGDGVEGGWLECAVHRNSTWDEHVRLITAPNPALAPWPQTDGAVAEVVMPLHGDGIERAVDLMVAAAARWGVDPPGLMLSFGSSDDVEIDRSRSSSS